MGRKAKPTVKWTIAAILDRGIDALGSEVDRLARACPLSTTQGRQLAAYVRAAVWLAREEREARNPKKNGGLPANADEFAAGIIEALRTDPALQQVVLAGLQEGRAS